MLSPPILPPPARDRLPDLVGDLRQLASVQRVALSDGPDRGQSLIQFSTGGGLEFSVKEAGSLDIASLRFRGIPVGWRHPAGDMGNAERALTGFLVTCGLENVRAPRNGLRKHGSLALSGVRVLRSDEGWEGPSPALVVEGEIVQPQPNGAVLRLTRRISAAIGGQSLAIEDRVDNISATDAEMMILYHFNFGFPVVAPGCEVALDGRMIERVELGGFETNPGTPLCHTAPREGHVTLHRPASGDWPGLRATLRFNGETLPYLQTWRAARATSWRSSRSIARSNRTARATKAHGFHRATAVRCA